MPPSINAQVAPPAPGYQPGPWALPPEKPLTLEQSLEAQLAQELNSPDGPSSQTVQALATSLNQLRLSHGAPKPDKWTVVNVGGGKVALVDAKTGEHKVEDVSGTGGRPATVNPGEGVFNPQTGAYDVPVPSTANTGGKTPAQITAESNANVNQSNASANASNAQAARAVAEMRNLQSPQQQQADALARIRATASAQGQAAVQELQAKIDAGLVLSDKDKLDLTAKLNEIAADAKAQRDQAYEQFKYDLAKPDVAANRALAERQVAATEQNANTQATQVENQRINDQRQTSLRQAEGQAKILGEQATAGQNAITMGVNAGVAPSADVIQYAFSPLLQAQKLMREAISMGSVPQTAMPTPQAPQPVAQTQAPAYQEAPQPGKFWR